jgi:hypothetical protein
LRRAEIWNRRAVLCICGRSSYAKEQTMDPATSTATAPSRGMLRTGRVVSALPVLMFVPGIVMGLTRNPQALEGMKKFGWSEDGLLLTAVLMIVSAILYLVPQTAVFGAIVLTGYFGGAIATHVRIHDPGWPAALVCGILVWLGLYLRDPRMRELVPLRKL